MAFFRHYQCPECQGTFRWLHHPQDEPPPNFCPLCGTCVNMDPTFVPAAPHVAKTIGTTADNVYRQMEEAGKARMEMAAELGGGEASDYSGLSVTDMPDHLRPGDIAANIADNPVSQALAANPGGVGFQPGTTGSGYAGAISSGVFPRRGDATRQNIQAGHQERVRAIEAMGRYSK